MYYETIIIGSGPAGLMCAKNLKDCLILEKNSAPAKKLLITGGGRCNITNNYDYKSFLSELNNAFLKFTLKGMGSKEVFDYFNNYVPLKYEDSKVYPVSNKASDVVDFLISKINISLNTEVLDISKEELFIIKTSKGIFKSKFLVIATGGASYSQLGSTGDGYRFAKEFGHKIVPIYPALVQLKTEQFSSLIGSSFDVELFIENKKALGSIIITHKGLSGPAAFKISEHVKNNLFINFLPNFSKKELDLKFINYKQNKQVISFLKEFFSDKLALFILENSNLNGDILISNISKEKRRILLNNISEFSIKVTSKDPLNLAFVTGGGVSTMEINPKTMESKIIDNLYFVGEVVNVHGPTGGFNITIALSMGYCAAISIAKKL